MLFNRLSAMSVTDISTTTTKHIKDFASQQAEQVQRFSRNLSDFRSSVVVHSVLDACKSTFSDAGFSYDEYAAEVMVFRAEKGSSLGLGGGLQGESTISGISQLR